MNFPKFLFSFLLFINAIYCINLPSNAEGNFIKKDQTKLIKRSHWDNDFNSKIFDDMRKELENNLLYIHILLFILFYLFYFILFYFILFYFILLHIFFY